MSVEEGYISSDIQTLTQNPLVKSLAFINFSCSSIWQWWQFNCKSLCIKVTAKWLNVNDLKIGRQKHISTVKKSFYVTQNMMKIIISFDLDFFLLNIYLFLMALYCIIADILDLNLAQKVPFTIFYLSALVYNAKKMAKDNFTLQWIFWLYKGVGCLAGYCPKIFVQ